MGFAGRLDLVQGDLELFAFSQGRQSLPDGTPDIQPLLRVRAVAAGADVLVAGSAIFNDRERVITAMER
jgi:hypothetical protein